MGSKCIKDIKVVYNSSKLDTYSNSTEEANICHPKEKIQLPIRDNGAMIAATITSNSNSGERKQPKKSKVINEIFARQEHHVLKLIKKHNRQCEDADLIENCLLKHFFMRNLEKPARQEIVKEMSLCSVPEGTVLFQQGMMGSFFYIIKEGKVDLTINDISVKVLTQGDTFGELALLHGAPRSGTVRAITDCLLWVLERKNFRKIVEYITQNTFEENKRFVSTIPILANIEQDQRTLLCSNLYKSIFEEGDYIVKKGEQASCLYIIKEGEVDCISNGILVRTLRPGDHFGERSILIEGTRTMDVIAKTKCICFSISVSTLQSMLGPEFRSMLYLDFLKSSFAASRYLKMFNLKLLDNLFEHFNAKNFGKDEVAYPIGHVMSSKLVVIIDGSLISKQEVIAQRGTILFENELIHNSQESIECDLIASPDCLLIEADMEAITKALGGYFNEILEKYSVIDVLQKVNIFRNLIQGKLEEISEKIGIEKFENGGKIISQGEEGSKFYIVKSGKVDIFINSNYIRTINENEYFGERALLIREPRSASAIANGPVEVFYLEKEDFLSIIENNMKDHLTNRLFLQDNTIELKDLDYHQQLGVGNYGIVSLVQSRKNKFYYAIKAISKKQIEYEQLHRNLELEKAILLQIDHPFIVKLVKTLKDTHYVYFLMEYIKGKELFDLIREIGLLNKYQTQFYGASMMLAVDYLHERRYVYRDVKPENIIVVESGYIKLIDFGTAKVINDRTSTIIGTPHYMAPEVILGEGYSFPVDYWSIAICMHEFLCGFVPFGESAEDPLDVYNAIINDKITFPSFCIDKNFKHLISGMLSKSPITRLCKLNVIKSENWFADFNWEKLISLSIEPAYVPKLPKESSKKNIIPYTEQVSNFQEWQSASEVTIDTSLKENFDNWFQTF